MSESALRKSTSAFARAETPEQWIEADGILSVVIRQFNEMVAAAKEERLAALERIGEVSTPDGRRFYVGSVKRTKARDLAKLTEAVLDACGGDLEPFIESLSANAFKPGHCRSILGDRWHEHFTVEEIEDVKTGKAKKAVQLADDRYTTR